MKTTVLVYIDRENTSMGMRIASQEEFTKILIKNKELPLQERRLFTKDVIADTDGLDVMYIETGLSEYQKWNSKQTYRNRIQNEKRNYKRSPILRGDILYAELGAAVGSEQAGFRPVVVVQNDVGNRYSPTVVVAPLTSNIRKNILPTHVHVGRESGVRPSLVLLEQLRTVDKCRLGDKIGHVNKSVMRRVDAAAAISLGLRSLQKDEV